MKNIYRNVQKLKIYLIDGCINDTYVCATMNKQMDDVKLFNETVKEFDETVKEFDKIVKKIERNEKKISKIKEEIGYIKKQITDGIYIDEIEKKIYEIVKKTNKIFSTKEKLNETTKKLDGIMKKLNGNEKNTQGGMYQMAAIKMNCNMLKFIDFEKHKAMKNETNPFFALKSEFTPEKKKNIKQHITKHKVDNKSKFYCVNKPIKNINQPSKY